MQVLSALLSENGLPNLPVLLVEPHRNRVGGWSVKFSYESSEPLLMMVDQASALAQSLKLLAETELAVEIDEAVQRALRYNKM